MSWAYAMASKVLPAYRSRFSRKEYTSAQLFACLVLREMLGLSFRATETVLKDADWCQRLGMDQVPDHTTLCRAFKTIVTTTHAQRMLDLIPSCRVGDRKVGSCLAIDSTLCETHHRSRHYERRCRQFSSEQKHTANARRSRSARRTPKLTLGIDTATHLILSAKTKTGMGADTADLPELLYQAWTRHRITPVLADAGYDSEANHRFARLDLGVRSLMPARNGKRTTKPPPTRFRRLMHRQLRGSQKGKPYGQRAQVETVMSMIKRNLGDELRAKTTHRRKMELLLKVLTHNLMILRRQHPGSQHSRSDPVWAITYTQTLLAGH